MRELHPTPYRTHISAHDFETAGSFIQAAKNYPPSAIEYEALVECAVIRYARPLSSNERRGSGKADARLSVNVQQILLSQGDVDLHNRIITLRNKMVAHAESEFYPTTLLDPVGTSRASGFAVASTRWHILGENLDLDAFARIAEAMRRACLNQMLDWMDKPEADTPAAAAPNADERAAKPTG
jgi:hypothetical protein